MSQPSSATSPRFPRFKRFGLKSPPKPPQQAQAEDEWYIPYNGPYEIPKELPKPPRDSWGEIIEDTFTAHRDLFEPASGMKTRSRAFSHASHQTGSSGAVDPNRKSMAASLRLPPSPPPRLPAPSFTTTRAGGVGESPMPRTRSPTSPISTTRMAFATMFGLGSQQGSDGSTTMTKRPSMPSLVRVGSFGRPRAGSDQPRPVGDFPPTAPPITVKATTPKEELRDIHYDSLLRRQNASRPDVYTVFTPVSPSLENLQTPTSSSNIHSSQQTSQQTHNTSMTSHPYASAAPLPSTPTFAQKGKARAIDPPDQNYPPQAHSVRLALPSKTSPVPPYLQPSAATSKASILGSLSRLKTSLSTPNLRSPSRSHLPSSPELGQMRDARQKGRDRWLSAETWCDALLFPRPRFKVRQGSNSPSPRRGNMVSPPPEVVWPPAAPTQVDQTRSGNGRSAAGSERATSGKVVHKSHSQTEISAARVRANTVLSGSAPPTANGSGTVPERRLEVTIPEEDIEEARFRGNVLPTGFLSPRDALGAKSNGEGSNTRSKRFSWDDMAIPSPVPSLSKYVALCWASKPSLPRLLVVLIKRSVFFLSQGARRRRTIGT
jgi:serine/arginine repetitive matrix protein 2